MRRATPSTSELTVKTPVVTPWSMAMRSALVGLKRSSAVVADRIARQDSEPSSRTKA